MHNLASITSHDLYSSETFMPSLSIHEYKSSYMTLNLYIAFIDQATFVIPELYEQAIKYEKGSFITSAGALATLSGAKTGRAPRDKRVVFDETTAEELWWGK